MRNTKFIYEFFELFFTKNSFLYKFYTLNFHLTIKQLKLNNFIRKNLFFI